MARRPAQGVGRSERHPTRYNGSPMASWAGKLGLDRAAVNHSVRTAVAALASMLLARTLKLPEFYWAPISTIVILLSTVSPRALAWQRFAGTAVGAVLGALIASFFRPTWLVYSIGIFVCGILSAILRLHSAYRFAGITLTIILLISHERSPWIVATHRFVEVSLGIAVGLLVTIIWPLPSP